MSKRSKNNRNDDYITYYEFLELFQNRNRNNEIEGVFLMKVLNVLKNDPKLSVQSIRKLIDIEEILKQEYPITYSLDFGCANCSDSDSDSDLDGSVNFGDSTGILNPSTFKPTVDFGDSTGTFNP